MRSKTNLRTPLTMFAVLFLLAQLTFAELPRYEIIDLGTLGRLGSRARSINDDGHVVGHTSSPYLAFLWSDGTMVELGTLGGHSRAYAINSNGQIAGYSHYSGREFHAFIWSNGVMKDLSDPDVSYSSAHGINDAGLVVGHSSNLTAELYALLWDGEGGVIDLGSLGGGR